MRKINNTLENSNVNAVLEVGGIDRPLLEKGQGYQYDGLDIEQRERCFEIYDDFTVQSIEQPVSKNYDLIISKTVLEHVPDNLASIKTMYTALNAGGETHHYVPSKWHPYAISLRIVGAKLQKKLIPALRPGAEVNSGYPAFFSHCSVPAMKKAFRNQGFSTVEFTSFYRATDYFAFFVPFFFLVATFENLCRYFNLQVFSSGYIVSAKK